MRKQVQTGGGTWTHHKASERNSQGQIPGLMILSPALVHNHAVCARNIWKSLHAFWAFLHSVSHLTPKSTSLRMLVGEWVLANLVWKSWGNRDKQTNDLGMYFAGPVFKTSRTKHSKLKLWPLASRAPSQLGRNSLNGSSSFFIKMVGPLDRKCFLFCLDFLQDKAKKYWKFHKILEISKCKLALGTSYLAPSHCHMNPCGPRHATPHYAEIRKG